MQNAQEKESERNIFYLVSLSEWQPRSNWNMLRHLKSSSFFKERVKNKLANVGILSQLKDPPPCRLGQKIIVFKVFFVLFVYEKRFISLFPTPFGHFYFYPFPGLIWWVYLRPCPIFPHKRRKLMQPLSDSSHYWLQIFAKYGLICRFCYPFLAAKIAFSC